MAQCHQEGPLSTAGQALADSISLTGKKGPLRIPLFCCFEVEDVSRPLLRPVAGGRLEKGSEQRREGSSQVVPERCKGYEELLGGDTDPGFIEPVGEDSRRLLLRKALAGS